MIPILYDTHGCWLRGITATGYLHVALRPIDLVLMNFLVYFGQEGLPGEIEVAAGM
jgi:hypothetical protein